MTVRELIEELYGYPDEAVVCIGVRVNGRDTSLEVLAILNAVSCSMNQGAHVWLEHWDEKDLPVAKVLREGRMFCDR